MCAQEFKYPFVFGEKDFTSIEKKMSNLSIKISTNNNFKNWEDLLNFKFTENDKEIIDKKDWGTIFHLALSKISSIDLISKVINDLLVQGLCIKSEYINLEKQINEFLSHHEIRSYFFITFEEINEKEILLRDGRSFIPDKVIIKDDEVLIIDFKTGVKKDDHVKKIQEYADIYSLMGYRNIKTKLIYIKNYIVDEQ